MNTIRTYTRHDESRVLKKRNRVSHYPFFTIKKVITYAVNHGLFTIYPPWDHHWFQLPHTAHKQSVPLSPIQLHSSAVAYGLICALVQAIPFLARRSTYGYAPDSLFALVCYILIIRCIRWDPAVNHYDPAVTYKDPAVRSRGLVRILSTPRLYLVIYAIPA